MEHKRMHCQNEIEAELEKIGDGYLPFDVLLKWFNDYYSTSKHLLTLYSIVRGLNAQKVGEIGVGRSSYALMLATKETGGKFYMCDIRDYRNLLTAEMKADISYTIGRAKDMYKAVGGGFDFLFLDYLSNTQLTKEKVAKEIQRALEVVKQNGIVAVHDGMLEKYHVKDALPFLSVTLPYNNGLTIIRRIAKSEYGSIDHPFAGKKPNTDKDTE